MSRADVKDGWCMQVPMMWWTEWLYQKLQSKITGNVIFWVSFCIIGQPIALMLYYHDYFVLSSKA